jgi:hypothetical protein
MRGGKASPGSELAPKSSARTRYSAEEKGEMPEEMPRDEPEVPIDPDLKAFAYRKAGRAVAADVLCFGRRPVSIRAKGKKRRPNVRLKSMFFTSCFDNSPGAKSLGEVMGEVMEHLYEDVRKRHPDLHLPRIKTVVSKTDDSPDRSTDSEHLVKIRQLIWYKTFRAPRRPKREAVLPVSEKT